jgi:three-Cys-motif partner protein
MDEAEDYDVVDYWSEVKLDIVKEYLTAYSTIMAAQKNPPFSYVYIDGFSGPGVCISKATGEYIPGSPLNALNVRPPFHEYYFIDMDGGKAAKLQELCAGMDKVVVREGNCNEILLEEIFPNIEYERYRRGLCLLDPYKMDVQWRVVEEAGRARSLELFMNFPTMDINRNALRKDPSKIKDSSADRMTAFWGDDSWRGEFYQEKDAPLPIFEVEEEREASNLQVVNAYRGRLKDIAGFKYVSEGMPMRNRRNSVVYYLLFASQKPAANDIVEYIFNKYKDRGAP